jgi:hypothetical protein
VRFIWDLNGFIWIYMDLYGYNIVILYLNGYTILIYMGFSVMGGYWGRR